MRQSELSTLKFGIWAGDLTETPQRHAKLLQHTGWLPSKGQAGRGSAERDLSRYRKHKVGLESKENSLATQVGYETRRDLPQF